MGELKINPSVLEDLIQRRTATFTPDEAWRMYAPPRTLGATEEHQLAMDDHLQSCGYNSLLAHAIGLGMGAFEVAPQFLGYPYLAGLSQNAIIRAGVTTVADEMTKKWVEIKRGGKASKLDKRVNQITTCINDFGLKDVFNEAVQKADFDGGCLVYIDTGETDTDKLQYPLYTDPSMWGDRKIERFTLVEAINLYPGLYNASDPLRKDYFKPTHWMVLGRKIHASRFLYFAPNKLPLLLKPAYNFFGIPVAQTALDYVAHFTKTREAAQRLLTKFSLTVFKSDMSAILSGGTAGQFDMRMQYLTQWRDNDMILAIDKEREDIVKLETPLAGVTDIVRQALEFVAAIFRIPFVKFLGISPGGLNATGEADLRNFYDHIASKQEKMFQPQMNHVLDLIQLHLFHEIDPEIKAVFCPLNDEDDSQREVTQKTKADRLAVLTGGGIISEEEARRTLADDPDSDLTFIDPEAVPEPPQEEGGFGGGFGAPEEEQKEMKGAMMREEGAMAAMDAEPKEWITVNGTHIPLDKDGELSGKVGEKISGGEWGEYKTNDNGYKSRRMKVSETVQIGEFVTPKGKKTYSVYEYDENGKPQLFSELRDKEYKNEAAALKAANNLEGAKRGARVAAKNKEKYSSIPNTWDGNAKSISKKLIDEGIGIRRFSQSTQSKSKYIELDNGVKIRMSDHNLPSSYDESDVDFRYGGSIDDLMKEIRQASSGVATDGATILLNVKYADKDRAKAAGARWDADNKKWYFGGADLPEGLKEFASDAALAMDEALSAGQLEVLRLFFR